MKEEEMIIRNKNFNIKQIAESGQCFRMNPISEEGKLKYSLIAYGRYLELEQLEDEVVELSCSKNEYDEIWHDYFDMDYDYHRIVENLKSGRDQFLSQAATYGHGIRILKQEPFEAAISFIISQNKNIPAIKNCVEAICNRYGEKSVCSRTGKEYYSFPSATILAEAANEELRQLKTGYRDAYIISAARAVTSGAIDFTYLINCAFEEAVVELKKIHGIGEKVANCIALYGLHHIEGFPVDVWILRVLEEIYQNQFERELYKGYAGIVQQYMFYYMRHLKS